MHILSKQKEMNKSKQKEAKKIKEIMKNFSEIVSPLPLCCLFVSMRHFIVSMNFHCARKHKFHVSHVDFFSLTVALSSTLYILFLFI